MDTRTKREADLSSAHEKLDKINIQRGRLTKREQNLGAEGEEFEPLKELFPEEKKVPLRFRFKDHPGSGCINSETSRQDPGEIDVDLLDFREIPRPNVPSSRPALSP